MFQYARVSANLIVATCLWVCYVQGAMISTGTFYQKISNGEDEANAITSNIITKEFHQCSLQDECNYVAKKEGAVEKIKEIKEIMKTGKTTEIWKKVKKNESFKQNTKVFDSCKDAMEKGQKENGTVELMVKGSKLRVYCDMITDGGGWIFFQRRTNSSVNFTRNWKEYETGFGNIQGNFWLGLKALHNLTIVGNHTLRVDLQHRSGDRGYAKYTNFKIGSADEKYKITFDGYKGIIGDALKHMHGKPFSTYDRDNDGTDRWNCAKERKGGWWFYAGYCGAVSLNKLYPTSFGNIATKKREMSWSSWKDDYGSITYSEMKIKVEF